MDVCFGLFLESFVAQLNCQFENLNRFICSGQRFIQMCGHGISEVAGVMLTHFCLHEANGSQFVMENFLLSDWVDWRFVDAVTQHVQRNQAIIHGIAQWFFWPHHGSGRSTDCGEITPGTNLTGGRSTDRRCVRKWSGVSESNLVCPKAIWCARKQSGVSKSNLVCPKAIRDSCTKNY